MESEVNLLRRRYLDSVQSNKSMKQMLRVQKDKSRQLIVACAYKLQEKEAEIKNLRLQHEEELSLIERELTFLQANMLKEQKRLEAIIAEKKVALENQQSEIDRLQKQNKKLLATIRDEDRDMDTPSSEDSSPKSSFSNKAAKIEIKPRLPQQPLHSDLMILSPTKEDLPPTIASPPKPVIVTKRPPPPPPTSPSTALPSQPLSQKPPVPSRAGIDRKLQKSVSAPPPPPVRSVSLQNGSSIVLTKDDSGRESDATDIEYHQDSCLRTLINPDDNIVAGDEGFCSSHEDQHNNNNNNQKAVYDSYLESVGLNSKSIIVSPSRLLTNHRAVQKPSDIKFRSKLKSTAVSSLAVLEEHQVTGDGQITTVTYWTEPYL